MLFCNRRENQQIFKEEYKMKRIRELTVEQMAERVLLRIPELEKSYVIACLQSNQKYGLDELSVQRWVDYFDSIVIDGKSA